MFKLRKHYWFLVIVLISCFLYVFLRAKLAFIQQDMGMESKLVYSLDYDRKTIDFMAKGDSLYMQVGNDKYGVERRPSTIVLHDNKHRLYLDATSDLYIFQDGEIVKPIASFEWNARKASVYDLSIEEDYLFSKTEELILAYPIIYYTSVPLDKPFKLWGWGITVNSHYTRFDLEYEEFKQFIDTLTLEEAEIEFDTQKYNNPIADISLEYGYWKFDFNYELFDHYSISYRLLEKGGTAYLIENINEFDKSYPRTVYRLTQEQKERFIEFSKIK